MTTEQLTVEVIAELQDDHRRALKQKIRDHLQCIAAKQRAIKDLQASLAETQRSLKELDCSELKFEGVL